MSHEIHRRDFLKASAASVAAFMAGDLLKGENAVAQGITRIPEVDKLAITVIADNYYDTLRPSTTFATRHYIHPGTSLHAEHGLSYYIETVFNSKSHAFMLDYGLDLQGVTRNIDELKLDLTKIEALGLSHGHWDHWGNLLGMLKNRKGELREGIPLYVGEEAFAHRFSKRADGLSDLELRQHRDYRRERGEPVRHRNRLGVHRRSSSAQRAGRGAPAAPDRASTDRCRPC